jgi:hypothetical protein
MLAPTGAADVAAALSAERSYEGASTTDSLEHIRMYIAVLSDVSLAAHDSSLRVLLIVLLRSTW